jgi:molybdopterin/thiamine biosynthesis adenylyltransferase
MPGKFHHESLFRGPDLLSRLATVRVTLCGAGAVGSNLADNLARQGVARLRVIDHDRVEEHNVSTQLYGESDVGTWKVEALRNRLFRATGIEIDAVRKELAPSNARQLLKESDLIIDAFDNAAARQAVQDHARAAATACMHVGLNAGYCEVIWDEQYRVPRDTPGDVCDYPLARNLVLLAVTIASETIIRMIGNGERLNWSGTLQDLSVRPLEPDVPGILRH